MKFTNPKLTRVLQTLFFFTFQPSHKIRLFKLKMLMCHKIPGHYIQAIVEVWVEAHNAVHHPFSFHHPIPTKSFSLTIQPSFFTSTIKPISPTILPPSYPTFNLIPNMPIKPFMPISSVHFILYPFVAYFPTSMKSHACAHLQLLIVLTFKSTIPTSHSLPLALNTPPNLCFSHYPWLYFTPIPCTWPPITSNKSNTHISNRSCPSLCPLPYPLSFSSHPPNPPPSSALHPLSRRFWCWKRTTGPHRRCNCSTQATPSLSPLTTSSLFTPATMSSKSWTPPMLQSGRLRFGGSHRSSIFALGGCIRVMW